MCSIDSGEAFAHVEMWRIWLVSGEVLRKDDGADLGPYQALPSRILRSRARKSDEVEAGRGEIDGAGKPVVGTGGHIDICVLGAFQVSIHGDLANWHTGVPGAIPAVGGAMDLAIGAKRTFVMMELLTRGGASKLVESCSYPLTGLACVSRVYTDHAVFDVGPQGASVVEMIDGLTLDALQDIAGVPLRLAVGAG